MIKGDPEPKQQLGIQQGNPTAAAGYTAAGVIL
jgi:hypothetical protein